MIKLSQAQKDELIGCLEVIAQAFSSGEVEVIYPRADQHLEDNIEYVRYSEMLPPNKGYWLNMVADRSRFPLPGWFPRYGKRKKGESEEQYYRIESNNAVNDDSHLPKKIMIPTPLSALDSKLKEKINEKPSKRLCDIAEAEREVSELTESISALRDRIHQKKRFIEETKKATVKVTDHALIRYMERVLGWDLSGVRHQITDIVQLTADQHGDCIVDNNGFQFVLRNDAVTSILDQNQFASIEQPKDRVSDTKTVAA